MEPDFPRWERREPDPQVHQEVVQSQGRTGQDCPPLDLGGELGLPRQALF
jgi:hypothetical protein